MWVLVKQIESTTTERELERFATRAFLPGWLTVPVRRHGAIKRCEILQITDRRTNICEYHGLVRLEPVTKAQLLVQRLDGTRFKGRTVEVRQFQRRISQRDRRQPFNEWRSTGLQDRRRRDRRRPDLHIKIPHAPQLEKVLGVHHQF